jgi:hypothetical protein
MTGKLKFLVPQISEAAQWLLGKEVEPTHFDFDCDSCGCPICVFFYAEPAPSRCPLRLVWR